MTLVRVSCFLVLMESYLMVTSFSEQSGYDRLHSRAELLKKFDLKIPEYHDGPKPDVPQYMLELYHDVTNQQSSVNTYNSSLVKAFYETEEEHGDTFVFRLLDISQGDQILQSELVVYYSHLRDSQHHKIPKRSLDQLEVHALTINSSTLLESRYVTRGVKGWQKFQLGKELLKYMDNNYNIRLQVNARDKYGKALHIKFHHGKRGSTLPSLVLFFQEAKHLVISSETPSMSRRTKRSNDIAKQMPEKDVPESFCQKKSLRINFNTIGFTWIIAPIGYDAGQCVGGCTWPWPSISGSNHAYLLSLYSTLGLKPIRGPCCAATEYRPLSVLVDQGDTVILKTYSDMELVRCGCH